MSKMKNTSYGMALVPQLAKNPLQKTEENDIQMFPVASPLTNRNFYSRNQRDSVS
jgi:hypothetical protein